MDENFSLAGILFIALLFVAGWFWHDHSVMSKKLEEANNNLYTANQRMQIAQEVANDKSVSATSLQNCLDNADANYNSAFQADCEAERNANCNTNPTVYISVSNHLDDERDKAKDFCLKQFPQK